MKAAPCCSPSGTAEEWLTRGESLLATHDLQNCRLALNEAERLGACADRCCGLRWSLAMLEGDFESAWKESDALRRRNAPDPHRFWNGRSIEGEVVIVRCLHGLGDTVQMMQYASLLQASASRVIFEVQPRMLPLAHHFRGVTEAVTWTDGPSSIPWTAQIEVMELPYYFRTTRPQLPLATNYLDVPPITLQCGQDTPGGCARMRVGLVWAAGDWDPQRSVPLPLLTPLLCMDGIEFWNLQGGSAAEEANGLPIRDATDEYGDGLLPLTSVIAQLDLVITVDTLAAHLAGALGTPAWVMLQYAADWRWMTGRSDSPWYPSLRLFRQSQPGDWRRVVEDILTALKHSTRETLSL